LARRLRLEIVGHEADVDAAIFSAALGGGVLLHWGVFAEANDEDLVRGHVVLGGQVLGDGGGAALTEVIVVDGIAN